MEIFIIGTVVVFVIVLIFLSTYFSKEIRHLRVQRKELELIGEKLENIRQRSEVEDLSDAENKKIKIEIDNLMEKLKIIGRKINKRS